MSAVCCLSHNWFISLQKYVLRTSNKAHEYLAHTFRHCSGLQATIQHALHETVLLFELHIPLASYIHLFKNEQMYEQTER